MEIEFLATLGNCRFQGPDLEHTQGHGNLHCGQALYLEHSEVGNLEVPFEKHGNRPPLSK